jgi:hypothetical protein
MLESAPKTHEMLYRAHEGGDSDDLNVAAIGWLDAVHTFAVDGLKSGLPVSEIMPAVVQMLEGWMLARDAASLMTTWAALDATVTVLERRLAAVRDERDEGRLQVFELQRVLKRERKRRRKRARRK